MMDDDEVIAVADPHVAEKARCSLQRCLRKVQKQHPLVHCMTNDVVTNATANALLACGASPLMVVEPEECQAMAIRADGLLINIGTFSATRADAMHQTIAVRHEQGKAWIFDPVAVGVLAPRTEWALGIVAQHPPTIVRGNASEIIALVGGKGGRGTDSLIQPRDALPAARQLLTLGVKAVAISGETDLIVTADEVLAVQHGHALLTRITGAGCMLGAIMAALVGLEDMTAGDAALAATLWFTLAAEYAVRSSAGPGSLMVALLDALYEIAEESVALPDLRVGRVYATSGASVLPQRHACDPRPPIAMTIAGTDPTGGAGLQADLSAFRALDVFGASTITAVVAQNTLGVSDVMPLPPRMIKAQMDAVFEDLDVDALKIGMLGQADIIIAVAEGLLEHGDGEHPPCDVILDPVMISTSGHALLAADAERLLWEQLVPLASLITPNLAEAEALLGYDVAPTAEGVEAAARALRKQGARQVLVKGGHMEGRVALDVFVDEQGQAHHLALPRVNTPNTHGTGCVLSSAITALRAQGHDWLTAISLARQFLQEALQTGQSERFTLGHGPCLIHLPRRVKV